jgi:hypothetical protein
MPGSGCRAVDAAQWMPGILLTRENVVTRETPDPAMYRGSRALAVVI